MKFFKTYRGYTITRNPSTGDYFISKDGCIVHTVSSDESKELLEYVLTQVDNLS